MIEKIVLDFVNEAYYAWDDFLVFNDTIYDFDNEKDDSVIPCMLMEIYRFLDAKGYTSPGYRISKHKLYMLTNDHTAEQGKLERKFFNEGQLVDLLKVLMKAYHNVHVNSPNGIS